MSDESPVTVIFNPVPAEAVQQPLAEAPAADAARPEPTQEQAQAVEAVFAQQEENRLVAGMLGLWTGALVLRDLAVDAFARPAEEDQPRLKKKAQENEADPPR